ncbi:MAG: hypothetical protein ABR591_08445 [Candidatus Velthaea sp.]
MIGSATMDALARIQSRAEDALQAYRAGGAARSDDANLASRPPEYASDPLSVAAPANAYFATADAAGRTAYTRDGGFRLADGALVTKDGRAVLGFPAGDARGAVPLPLRLPAADVALGRCGDARIESDGTLAFTRTSVDPRTAELTVERVVAGKIGLARFPAGTLPVRIDGAHVGAPRGVPPHLGTPADGVFAGLATYARDTGAIDVETSIAKLAEAYLAFSALHAAQKARGAADKTSMDLVK